MLIAPDRATAYVPIHGDGTHGKNPHPGHLIALFDLKARRHIGDFSTCPYLAPHGLRWGPQGQLYCVCENSGVVLEMDAETGEIGHVIEVGSTKAHRIEVQPDGSKLYAENEEDASASDRAGRALRLRQRGLAPAKCCRLGRGGSPTWPPSNAFLRAGLGWGSMSVNATETDFTERLLVPLVLDDADPKGYAMPTWMV